MSTYPHFGTNAIHVGQDPEQWNCKALVPPIFTTTTYKQDEPGKPVRIIVTYCSLHSLCFFLSLSLCLSISVCFSLYVSHSPSSLPPFLSSSFSLHSFLPPSPLPLFPPFLPSLPLSQCMITLERVIQQGQH